MRFLPLVLFITAVNGHSWLDCLDHNPDAPHGILPQYDWVYNAAGTLGVCEGYARYYPSRADPNIGYHIEQGGFTRLYYEGQEVAMCTEPPGEFYSTAESWLHMLNATSGDTIYYGYMSNGHVAKDEQAKGTTVEIWWQPVFGHTLWTTFDLVPDNLLSEKPFPDGNCGEEVNKHGQATGLAGERIPCVQSFIIPDVDTSGPYSFLWRWKDTNGAIWWSCFDVAITKKEEAFTTETPTTETPTTQTPTTETPTTETPTTETTNSDQPTRKCFDIKSDHTLSASMYDHVGHNNRRIRVG